MQLQCGTCGQRMETGAAPAGSQVVCPKCKAHVSVPGAASSRRPARPSGPPSAPAGEVDLRALRRKALIACRGGRHHGDVLQSLRDQHVDERTARELVCDAVDEAAAKRLSEGQREFLFGLGLLAVGTAVSLGTYLAASGPRGGVYVVFTGLIVGGLGMAVAGRRKQSVWRDYRDRALDELSR